MNFFKFFVIESSEGQIFPNLEPKGKKIPNLALFYPATANFNSEGNYLKHGCLFEFIKQSIQKNQSKHNLTREVFHVKPENPSLK